MNHYSIFGLSVGADFELPELLPAPPDSAPDIRVLRADIPPVIPEGSANRGAELFGPAIYRFEIAQVARYQIEQGATILVEPAVEAAPGDVRVWLLGTALGVLLHQRGLLPLHVSAVAVDGAAFAFCGHSGAGKSTLAAALHRRGLPLLTDDVALVTPDHHQAILYPGFARIKLWRDALDHFELDPQGLIPDMTRTDKYHLNLKQAGGFHAAALPMRRLYLLERSPGAQIFIEPVQGHNAIGLIGEHTYRVGIARRMGAAADHLVRCGQIAQRIQVFRFQRPWQHDSLTASTDALLAHMRDQPQPVDI